MAFTDKLEALKRYFGYDSFRPGQERVIDAILSGRDVLSVMPTGAGKSVCFQLPALMMNGVCIVVSPLVSLMKDQVGALRNRGIPACYINSLLTASKIRHTIRSAGKGRFKLIYIAPERLLSPAFLALADNLDISMICIDEAHCVSQWGRDFRPSYLAIKEFVSGLAKRPVVTAFTATATQSVQSDISELVGLADPFVEVTGFDRSKLFFDVVRVNDKMSWLESYLSENTGKSGIIYCSTRRNVMLVTQSLQNRGFSVLPFHAGMTSADRRLSQQEFLSGESDIIVATNAFGMGIDKPDVRFVIHCNLPADIESYYQEAGRAGRDGLTSDCILLYDKRDIDTQMYFVEQASSGQHDKKESVQQQMLRRQRLADMIDYCEGKNCYRHYILTYFGEASENRCGNCGACVKRTYSPLLKKSRKAIKQNGFSHELYKGLLELRSSLALKNRVSERRILSDKQMKRICTAPYPDSFEQLRDRCGLSGRQTRSYAVSILALIEDTFCAEK